LKCMIQKFFSCLPIIIWIATSLEIRFAAFNWYICR
jgi:hypothetical protein